MVYIRSLRQSTWYKVAGLLVLLNAATWAFTYLDFNHPYRKVELVEAYTQDGYLYTTHNFIKGDCDRIEVTFTMFKDGVGSFLVFEGLDGSEEGHNRDPGEQTLSGRMYIGDINPDYLLIRTKHDCDGDNEEPFTKKVFDRLEAKDIQKRDSRVSSGVLGVRGP